MLEGLVLRRGTPADLGEMNRIFHQQQTAGLASPPSLPFAGLPIFPHELESGEVWMAEMEGRVRGFAAAIVRGGTRFLAEMFVEADRRSIGLGGALTAKVLAPRDGEHRLTVASQDPRAISLYARAGLRPDWALLTLVGDGPRLRPLDPGGLEIVEAEPADPELVALDAEIGGRERLEDHAYWLRDCRASMLWLRRPRARKPVGYAVVRLLTDDWIGHQNAVAIGPVGARTPADAAAAVVATIAWARERGRELRVPLPGPHPALVPLLQAGFRIVDADTFAADPGREIFSPELYAPSGGALF